MKVKYVPFKSAKKDCFRSKVDEKEQANYDSFIESLKNINVEQVDVVKDIGKVLETTDIGEDVRKEILKRLGEKDESRK